MTQTRLNAGLFLSMLLGVCSCGDSGTSGNTPVSHLDLAKRYAPIFFQDINQGDGANGVSDFPMRFNYDTDWIGDNNWENFSNVKSWEKNGQIGPGGANSGGYDLRAHVYYSVVETEKNWFITYAVFHPRDWSNAALLFGLDEHENDLEGALVVVEKDGTPYGTCIGLLSPLDLNAQEQRHDA